MNREKILNLIKKGSDITGAAVGSGVGFLAAGPVGAAAGGALGPVVTHTLSEIANRALSDREEARVGATAQNAINHIERLKAVGRNVRDDGFFDGDRSDAEEVFEGCLIASKNSHEEKKSIYLGYLFANLCFRDDIDKHQANRLINVANQLSYSQLYLLNILQNKGKYNLRQGNFRSVKTTFKQVVILQEIFAMEQSGIMICEGQHTPGITDVNPSVVRVQGLGLALYELMQLFAIPLDECNEIAIHIRQE